MVLGQFVYYLKSVITLSHVIRGNKSQMERVLGGQSLLPGSAVTPSAASVNFSAPTCPITTYLFIVPFPVSFLSDCLDSMINQFVLKDVDEQQ